jgi:predicted MPP superfamily phosphohydrolase
MLDYFEEMGIKVLVNETVEIIKGDERIWVTGLDDPYYYYTDQSIRALEKTPNGFKITLAHAPSMFDAAEINGYKLYLCGHTHGGQICLPGGKPIILHLRHGRKYYRGLWQYGSMTGYTSQGTGCVGIPIRFNTQSEITLFKLNRNCD